MEAGQQDDHDLISRTQQRRDRMVALVYAVLSIISLISITYTFVQKGDAQEQKRFAVNEAKRADSLQIKLDRCAEGTLRQMKNAEMNAVEAMRQNQRAEEALKK